MGNFFTKRKKFFPLESYQVPGLLRIMNKLNIDNQSSEDKAVLISIIKNWERIGDNSSHLRKLLEDEFEFTFQGIDINTNASWIHNFVPH